MKDISLDGKGEICEEANDMVLLCDADTIVFAACSVVEIVEDILPREMYNDEEWEDLASLPGYSSEDKTLSYTNVDDVVTHSMEKLQLILDRTGCKEYELHFTMGRDSLPYKVLSTYKSNRTGFKAPQGLTEAKLKLKVMFPDNVFVHTRWEADHMVVCKKRDNPDKYIIAAVDKDVLLGIAGRHFNYYESQRFNIPMKWVEVEEADAVKRYYVQCLTGDASDGIPGIKGIGPKKAEKALANAVTEPECWEAVVSMYERHHMTVVDAAVTMRLVDMRQLKLDENNEYQENLWQPTLL